MKCCTYIKISRQVWGSNPYNHRDVLWKFNYYNNTWQNNDYSTILMKQTLFISTIQSTLGGPLVNPTKCFRTYDLRKAVDS